MSKTVSKFAFTAGLVLAMAFTFSCSSGDDDLPCLSCGDSGGYGDKGNDIENYRTVVIGTQTWMAENLNYAVAGSRCYGERAEVVIDFDEYGNPITTKTLSNAEVQANCVKYGRLYDWATAMALPSSCNENSCSNQIQPKHRGICPSGWHIPSNNDWDKLFRYVDIENGEEGYPPPTYHSYTAFRYLKAANGWSNNGNGTDQYGFSALPGGSGYDGILDDIGSSSYVNRFSGVGSTGAWWSSEYDYGSADIWRNHGYDGVTWMGVYKLSLISVRCVQDDETDPVGNQSSSSVWLSSSSYQPPPVLGDPNISITDTTFRWVTNSRQDEVLINVSVALTAVGGDLDTNIRGFDSVLVKLNGKLLNKGGQGYFFYQYNKTMDHLINVENELGLGICGGDVVLTVEVYAFGKKNVEARVNKTLRKDGNVGNCRSSSSATPSSSSAFQIKPLVSIFGSEGSISLRNGEGVDLETGGSGTDITVSITTSGGRETTLEIGSNIYTITDIFMTNVEMKECGARGYRYNPSSPNYDGTFNTGNFYPCLNADRLSSIDCRNTFKMVKTIASKDATDWTQGWYLIYCREEGVGENSTAKIEAWKVN